MAKPEKGALPVEFYSKYKGLGIMISRPVSRTDGTTVPGVKAQFKEHVFSSSDPEIIEHLKSRTVDGVKTCGRDYWLSEDMEAHVKKIPSSDRTLATLKMKDDKIAKLEKALAEEKAKNEKK